MSILKNLMVDTKSAWMEYPGAPGWEIEVATLARQELISLRKKCIITKFDRKTRQPTEEVDDQKFISLFTRATVKGWKGLKYKYLENLIPVDISQVDPEEEMPYSHEDAELLVANSSEFDTWLNEAVFDLDNFRSPTERRDVAASGEVAA